MARLGVFGVYIALVLVSVHGLHIRTTEEANATATPSDIIKMIIDLAPEVATRAGLEAGGSEGARTGAYVGRAAGIHAGASVGSETGAESGASAGSRAGLALASPYLTPVVDWLDSIEDRLQIIEWKLENAKIKVPVGFRAPSSGHSLLAVEGPLEDFGQGLGEYGARVGAVAGGRAGSILGHRIGELSGANGGAGAGKVAGIKSGAEAGYDAGEQTVTSATIRLAMWAADIETRMRTVSERLQNAEVQLPVVFTRASLLALGPGRSSQAQAVPSPELKFVMDYLGFVEDVAHRAGSRAGGNAGAYAGLRSGTRSGAEAGAYTGSIYGAQAGAYTGKDASRDLFLAPEAGPALGRFVEWAFTVEQRLYIFDQALKNFVMPAPEMPLRVVFGE